MHIEVYSGITKANELYLDIFKTLSKPLHIQLCHIQNPNLEPKASSKTCRTCRMIRHSQNSLLKHFQGCSGIFKDIDAYSATLAQVGGSGGGHPCPFFEIKKSDQKRVLIVSF